MKTILLFDIDGTLLHGPSDDRFSHAFKKKHNLAVEMHNGRDFGGYTDKLIIIDLLKEFGWDEDEIHSALPALLAELDLSHAATFTPETLVVFPGVKEMLDNLHRRPDVQLGILTGNTAAVAKRKLETAGVWKYFDFGSFSNDIHDKRSDLVTRAFEKANVDPSATTAYIIGDTARDIQAAHDAGIRGVGVLHGSKRAQGLYDANADAILKDFLDMNAVLEALNLT